jgi:hypothetical protein
MSDEIKVGSRVRHESYGGGLVLDSKKFVKFDQFVSVSVVADKDLTLIPDTVLVELSVEDAKYLRGFFCVDINGTDGAHNRLYTACKKALDEREGK